MPAYLVARISVQDAAGFDRYRAAVLPVIAAHGGHYIVRGGAMDVLEGTSPERVVIVEFPTMDAARGFYHSADYAPLLTLRMQSTESEVMLVEGFPPG